MSVHCAVCGAGLPRSAMDEDWEGCPHCLERKEAREVNKKLMEALVEVVALLRSISNK